MLIVLTAMGFGAGDFLAGLASRKAPVLTVSLYSQLVALALAAVAAIFLGGVPHPASMFWGFSAGVMVGLGIVRYYRGLTRGSMGWVATVMGAFSAMVPFVFGITIGERPSTIAIAGVFSVTAALFLVIQRKNVRGAVQTEKSIEKHRVNALGIRDGIIAGTCFGFSFVLLGLASTTNPLWPVLMTLAGSIPPILVFRFIQSPERASPHGAWSLIVATGICQALAFIAFALAVMDGYISIVSVAGALSPVATSLLAYWVLCERLTRRQVIAVAVAMAGIVCLVLG